MTILTAEMKRNFDSLLDSIENVEPEKTLNWVCTLAIRDKLRKELKPWYGCGTKGMANSIASRVTISIQLPYNEKNVEYIQLCGKKFAKGVAKVFGLYMDELGENAALRAVSGMSLYLEAE